MPRTLLSLSALSHIPRRAARRLLRDRRGAVAPLVGLAILSILLAAGVAVDTARGYLIRSKLTSAIDAAALAGGRDIFDPDIRDEIRMYFEANFPEGYLGATVTDFDVTVGPNRETVSVSAEVDLPTTIMGLAGFDTIEVAVSNRARRHVRGLELSLVLDVTGSMWGAKLDAMKEAAQLLTDILYGDEESIPNFWVSLVPYTATVNVGPEHEDWLTSLNEDAYWTTTWKGCVEARPSPHDESDDPPAVEPFEPFYYASTRWRFTDERDHPNDRVGDNDWGPSIKPGWGHGDENHEHTGPQGENEEGGSWPIQEGYQYRNEAVGPNLGCGPAITPLTAERSVVEDAIDELEAWSRGGTMANLGLVWGWRTLSPRWRGLWQGIADPKLPLDYGERYMDKAIVLLTDGENQWYDWPGGLPGEPDDDDYPDADYTAYGRLSEGRLGTTDNGQANTVLDDRMLATCNQLKQAGVLVYTITFKVSDIDTKDLFRACASGDRYWNSPSNDDLNAVFQEIGSELSNLRLEQ